MKFLFSTTTPGWAQDLGLFVLRAGAGGMMLFGHGLSKIENWETLKTQFTDLFGFGMTFDLSLTIFSEVFCAAAVILGLATRFTVLPLIVSMAVAILVVHKDDPMFMGGEGGSKEPAILYLLPYLMILLAGPGRISLDAQINGSASNKD